MQEDDRLMKDAQKKLLDFETLCRKEKLKITPQRIAVYKALLSSEDHPTAEEVYRQVRQDLSNISLDTVNRTLHTLTEIGAAYVVEGTGQPRRYDGGLEDHQHFRCMKCGSIIDFHYEPFDDLHIPEQLGKECTVLRKTVYFEGVCNSCKQNKKQD